MVYRHDIRDLDALAQYLRGDIANRTRSLSETHQAEKDGRAGRDPSLREGSSDSRCAAWHQPLKVVLPNGGVVQGHGLSGFISVDGHQPPDWALYLDEQWVTRATPWPRRMVGWPDFGLPLDVDDAFAAFAEAATRATAGQLIDIACDGGTGRTGTALACVATCAGVSPAEVVAWVRDHYHRWAVEVPEQEELIGQFHQWWLIHEGGPP